MKKAAVVLVALGGLMLLSGYTVRTVENLQHPRWETPVPLSLWTGFNDALSNVVDGSDPRSVIELALEQWVNAADLTVILFDTDEFEAGLATNPDGSVASSQRSIITAADTPANRSLVSGLAGVSVNTWLNNSQVIDSDVIFNPTLTWSTREAVGQDVSNIYQVALHEFGHNWNLGHSPLHSAVMFFTAASFSWVQPTLTWDDIAGVNQSYALPGWTQVTGRIEGRVARQSDRSPIFGAFVTAVDEWGQVVASGISLPDGSYEVAGLPEGDYVLYVEPLDGLTQPGNVSGSQQLPGSIENDFLLQFYQDSLTPSVSVAAGQVSSNIDFEVKTGNVSVRPELAAVLDDPFLDNFPPAANLVQGVDDILIVVGRNASQLDESGGLSFLSPQIGVESALDTGSEGRAYPLVVSPLTGEGPYSAIFRAGEEVSAISGLVHVSSPWRFLEAFAQISRIKGAAESSIFLVNTDLENETKGEILTRGGDGSLDPAAGNEGPIADRQDQLSAIAPGGSLLFTPETEGDFIGSARIRTDRPVGGTVLIETPFGTTGVGASRPLTSFVAPIERDAPALNTGVAVTNLDHRPARLFLQLVDQDGVAVKTLTLLLQGHGHFAQFVDEIFSEVPSTFQGSLFVSSTRRLGATVIRVAPEGFTTFPVITKHLSQSAFFSQFAHLQGLSSKIWISNPSASFAAEVQVRIRNSAGQLTPVGLDGTLHQDGTVSLVIPPRGARILQTTGNTDVVGSVEAFSSIPVSGVVLFQSSALGTAGVGQGVPLERLVLPVDRNEEQGQDTGIAVVNTRSEPVTLRLTVRNAAGEVIREGVEVELGAYSQIARFPNQEPFNLSLPPSFEGTIWITSTGPVVATVIRQLPGVLTTLPVVPVGRGLDTLAVRR